MLTTALAIAAFAIGVTGAWSPCGLSMVETIGPTGHTGGRRTTIAALASFVPGALLGGVATFGALAIAGSLLHGAGGRIAYAVAAAIALLAAVAEARGLRIVPQIRRQVPEHWRRVMPLPLAAFLYGVLLGLGFTTFVLSFGVWALAGISLALGEPSAGIAIGLAFGAGRALPVLALAPFCDREAGIRLTELMTQRPAIYRGFRAGDALALAAVGAAALTALPAGAAVRVAAGSGEPSAARAEFVYQSAGGPGILRREGRRVRLPGRLPAIGGPYIAVRRPGEIVLLARRGLSRRAALPARRVDGIAISAGWVAYRARRGGRDLIKVRRIYHLGIGAATGGRPRCRRLGTGHRCGGDGSSDRPQLRPGSGCRDLAPARRPQSPGSLPAGPALLDLESPPQRGDRASARQRAPQTPPRLPPLAGLRALGLGPLLCLRAQHQRAPAAPGSPPPRAGRREGGPLDAGDVLPRPRPRPRAPPASDPRCTHPIAAAPAGT